VKNTARVHTMQSGQSAHHALPRTYQYLNLSEPGRKGKVATMVPIVHYTRSLAVRKLSNGVLV
jgi:hypothetical protein